MDKRSMISMILLVVSVALIGFMLFWSIRHSNLGKTGTKAIADDEISKEELNHAEELDKASTIEDDGERVFFIPKDEVNSFLFTDSNGIVLNFEKQNDKWVYMDDKSLKINQERIDSLLNYLCDIRSVSFIADADGEEYGLNQDSKTYTLMDFDGNETIISVGNNDPDTDRVYFSINYDFSTIYVNSGKLAKVCEYGIEELVK